MSGRRKPKVWVKKSVYDEASVNGNGTVSKKDSKISNGIDDDNYSDMQDDGNNDVVVLDDAPTTSQAGPGRKRNIANVARGLELRHKYRRLEKDLEKMKSERDFFKKRSVALEPALAPSAVRTHEIDMDGDEEDFTDYRPPPFCIDNVEIEVCLMGRDVDSGHILKFTPYIRLSGDDDPRYVLAIVTVSQRSRMRIQSVQKTCTLKTLLDKPMTIMGLTETLNLTDDISNSQLSVHITAVVQKVELPGDAGESEISNENVIVVVQNKEFKVNAAYLSQWSRYFRAYFAVDMEEKKTGMYPIKDDDITAENFQELLNVIYPMQKPISNDNFKLLLKMSNRFEMPDLTRRIELFLMDNSAHGMDRAHVFRLATDKHCLSLVQATLLDRWRDPVKLRKELLTHHIYYSLEPGTKNMINQHFVDGSTHFTGQTIRSFVPSDDEDEAEDDDDDDDDVSEVVDRLQDQEWIMGNYLSFIGTPFRP